ncbi:MAG: hypothetical protein JWO82_2614 [Akkermansiaceae bacterium]|nr:hypothetical protein [Akkermansiaceae bacterium]
MPSSSQIPRKGSSIAETLDLLQYPQAAAAIEQAGDSFLLEFRFEIQGRSLRGDLAFDEGVLEEILLHGEAAEFTLPDPVEGWPSVKYHRDRDGNFFATLE